MKNNIEKQNDYQLSDYYYHLPKSLIAQHPAHKRDASALMVIDRKNGTEHKKFSDIINYLNPGDVLVINQTKVLPARLFGIKKNTGAKCEILLLKETETDIWHALVKPGRRIKKGDTIIFKEDLLQAEVLEELDGGNRLIKLCYHGELLQLLEKLGAMPLPPYIKEAPEDANSRYQTVYAQQVGSAAAPTAGLHFTEQLLAALKEKGVHIAPILLHVGLGTFLPVSEDDIRNHAMHSEYFEIPQTSADIINHAKKAGNRIIAVGTTSVRTLESNATGSGHISAQTGETDIFIYPGYRFKVVDAIVTNFHLPQSTLLMLVSAFAGRERMLKEYQEAVEREYRFFSFGDAMLIL